MKEYSLEKVINAILSLKTLHKMSLYSTSQVGKDTKVVAGDTETCFSQDTYYSRGPVVTLGTKFYASAFEDAPKTISVVDLKDKYRHIAKCYYGVFYHEMFHLLYTSFGAIRDLLSGCDYNFQQFAHQVSNILEDVTIETTGAIHYPKCKPFLEELSKIFSQASQLNNLKGAITSEPEGASTLLAYLLLYARGVDLSSIPEYKLWEDNKEFIKWGVYKCVYTPEARTRAKRQIAFALQLAKLLNNEEFDKDSIENPDLSDIQNQSSGKGGDGGTSGQGAEVLKSLKGLTNTATSGTHSNNPQDTASEGEIKDIEKEIKATRDGEGESDPSNRLDISPDLTQAGISMLANDEPVFKTGHWAEDLSKHYDSRELLPKYNKVVKAHEKEISSVVAQIKKMKATNNNAWQHYKMSGKLDMSTIYKKNNYKIFKKANAPKEEADLAFEILVDNSGSMRGNKAKLAGQALIIFCEALNRLQIPFSVDCFTEAHEAITISLKHYHELYDKTKTNMCLISEQVDVDALSTWYGNIDEINLQYVANELMEQPQKDKVLIVISDGATCGDWRTLKKVAENIEKQNVLVLGIGIYDHNVENIYSKHTVVSNQEDLEQLGTFLNKYLVKLIFKGGM